MCVSRCAWFRVDARYNVRVAKTEAAHLDDTVLAAADNPVAIRTEFQAVDGTGLPLVRLDAAFSSNVPDLRSKAVRARASRAADGQAGRRAGGQAGRRAGVQAGRRAGVQAQRGVAPFFCSRQWAAPARRCRTLRLVSSDPDATNSPKG